MSVDSGIQWNTLGIFMDLFSNLFPYSFIPVKYECLCPSDYSKTPRIGSTASTCEFNLLISDYICQN